MIDFLKTKIGIHPEDARLYVASGNGA